MMSWGVILILAVILKLGVGYSGMVHYPNNTRYPWLGVAPSDPWPVSRHAEKLFTRIRGVIKDRFADPDFGPSEVAAEAGISLRYLQKRVPGS
jgi:hypothetical protein